MGILRPTFRINRNHNSTFHAIFRLHYFCFGPPRTTMSSPQPSTSDNGNPKPTYWSLSKKTLSELKTMCGDAKLPKTGNKAQLMAWLIWGLKPTYESLGPKNIAEMRKMCADANLPKTGTKDQLMARIVDPAAHQKKGRKGSKVSEMAAVDKLFRDAGEDPTKINKCLKAGVLNGHIPLTEEGTIDLDQLLLKSGCNCCSKQLTCTIRDALHQIEYGGNEYEDGGESAAIQCRESDEGEEGCGGNFITGLCNGDFSFDCGKFHNHCTKCPNFGHCIGDYRNTCNGKGRVGWAGLSYGGKRRRNDCVLQ